MRGYFVTGTDTGVGKTFVTTAIARIATSRGKRVFAFKPIETGVPMLPDGTRQDSISTGPAGPSPNGAMSPLGEDQRALVDAAGNWQTGELCGVYQFALPAAPSVAAAAENRDIDLHLIVDVLARGSAGTDLVLVEGAGGWRVPVTETVDMGSLAKRFGFPVLIVARAGLGTINHSLLTIEAAERQGCSIAALVLSVRPEDDREFAHSNAKQIGRAWPGVVIVFDQRSALEALV